jgi:hypothetical protein
VCVHTISIKRQGKMTNHALYVCCSLRQFDIRTVFLNGDLKEEVFIRAPAGAEHLTGGSGKVIRLRRDLYGSRQAPRAWNQRLETALQSRGFVQYDADSALWILHGENGTVLSMFYMDDGLVVAAGTDVEADALVELVASIFEIRALGKPNDFLAIQISRDHAANTITITQRSKASALAAKLGVSRSHRVLPMPAEVYAGLRLVDIMRYVGSTAARGITYGGKRKTLDFW